MHIGYKPLWHTLLERDEKKDLRLAAGMTTNMIANMSKEESTSQYGHIGPYLRNAEFVRLPM